MASQPAPQLPLFYQDLTPLSSETHQDWGVIQRTDLKFARNTHAVPIIVDEFVQVQKFYPIVFTDGDDAVPLALVGLKEGSNLFIDDDGNWVQGTYIPAYVRRHPFMLARLQQDSEMLSLVFDSAAGLLSADADDKLFDAERKPTETTDNIMKFCESFEQGVARTRSFMDELKTLDLLMEGQAEIQNPGMDEPARFAGFRMIDEKKLQNIRGDQARKMVQNGMMGLIYAHLFSLAQMRELFARLNGEATG